MGIDTKTLMLITLAIALIAGGALLAESKATDERAQCLWGLGFLTIALGCGLTPLRDGISFQLGVWVSDGLLIVAHILFLFGSASYVRRGLPLHAWCALLVWLPLMLWPADASRTLAFAVTNAALVAGLALGCAVLLARHRAQDDWAAGRLALIFAVHGSFYAAKALLAWVPGGFVDIVTLKGVIIQVSMAEGVPVETLLLLVMAASARRRRETQLVSLAESDPLTGLLNRRAFDQQAQAMLHQDGLAPAPGALLLCDLNDFKAVNDTYGHAAGDAILTAFARLLRGTLPTGTLIGRYGGDEFVALLPKIDGEAMARLGAIIRRGPRTTLPAAGGPEIAATVTVGTAVAAPGMELVALLAKADSAAYAAKRRGPFFFAESEQPIRAAPVARKTEPSIPGRRAAAPRPALF